MPNNPRLKYSAFTVQNGVVNALRLDQPKLSDKIRKKEMIVSTNQNFAFSSLDVGKSLPSDFK